MAELQLWERFRELGEEMAHFAKSGWSYLEVKSIPDLRVNLPGIGIVGTTEGEAVIQQESSVG